MKYLMYIVPRALWLGVACLLLLQSGLILNAQDLFPLATNTPQPGRTVETFVFDETTTVAIDVQSVVVDMAGADVSGVLLEVVNNNTQTQPAAVWYVLSERSETPPWESAVYTAPTTIFSLQASTSEIITLPGVLRADIPSGEYDLSVYVHGVDFDREVRYHAAASERTQTVYFGAPRSVTVREVDVVNKPTINVVYTTFVVRNLTETPMQARLYYSLAETGDPQPWINGLYQAPFREVELDAGEMREITWRNEVPGALTPLDMTLWLQTQDDSGQWLPETADLFQGLSLPPAG